ncbi:MAG TPA: EAL domain-containing protein [Hyphomicrobiaceae bacterium]|nr:EAL domain-containing protein [Hyphomicrobiaceae bacterium]
MSEATNATGTRPRRIRPESLSLISVGVALLIAGALLTSYQYFSLRNSLRSDLTVQARLIGDNVQAALTFEDVRAAQDLLSSLKSSDTVTSAVVFNRNGREFARFDREHVPPDGDSARPFSRSPPYQIERMQVEQEIVLGGAPVGRIRIVGSLDQAYFRLALFIGATLLTSVLSMVLAKLLISGMHRAVKQAEERLDYLAHFDPVTNLFNRHAFNERLDFATKRARRFGNRVALLLLDLDNFKTVNDTLGHQAGDTLLKSVADRLGQRLRKSDAICRLGGDEFAVILENIADAQQAASLGQAVVEVISAPFEISGRKVFVTASCGIGVFPDHAEAAKDLIRSADTAMYHAKDAGKNISAVFRPEMTAKADRRINIEGSLRAALETDQMELYFQPKVDFVNRCLNGAEALLRWHHPLHGDISPVEFIPVAEVSGLIGPLGKWVLQKACAQAAAWQRKGYPSVDISVNISVIQLKDPRFVDIVADALAAAGLPARHLELELTESMLMEDVEANLGVMKRLRALGVQISIDDFGTGYSSMSYLKRFPITTLKIDRSFVSDLPNDRENAAITEAIIALAHALDLKTVAEGVETQAQAQELSEAGCDYLQGYLFSEPLPADAFIAWWKSSGLSTPNSDRSVAA